MPIPNRGLSGQPSLPYVDYRSYAGADVFLNVTCVDYQGNLVTPASLVFQVDDLTNAVNVVPPTVVTVIGPQMTLQISGAQLQMTHQWQGSEVFQIYMTATLANGSTLKSISVLELIAIQTPNGA